MITAAEIEELRALEAAATPGPWELSIGAAAIVAGGHRDVCWSPHWRDRVWEANAALIAHSRMLLPRLLAALDAARERATKAERLQSEWIAAALAGEGDVSRDLRRDVRPFRLRAAIAALQARVEGGDLRMPCGHPGACRAVGSEGTAHCTVCEEIGREREACAKTVDEWWERETSPSKAVMLTDLAGLIRARGGA